MTSLRYSLRVLAALVIGCVLAASGWSFTRVSVGSTIANTEMPTLQNGAHLLLGDERANVMLFFRPDQEHSRKALAGLARLIREFEGRSVHWVAVVSDVYSLEEIRAAVAEAEPEEQVLPVLPILIDVGDALSGRLGVPLHPVVGIVDQDHVLRAYEYFRKVNFINIIHARILYLLGEISETELARRVDPPRAESGGSASLARTNLKLAHLLLESGEADQALEKARKSLEYDPAQAGAHAFVGAVLASQGDCAGAVEEFDRALSLDPDEPTALKGKEDCLENGPRSRRP